jgi:hypothetical protein
MTHAAHRFAAASLIVATFATNPARAAEEFEDLLQLDWFEIEFFVFERSEVMEHNTAEKLTQHAIWRIPANITAQRPGEEGYESYYHLDAVTQLCLTYPPGYDAIEFLPGQDELPAILAAGLSGIRSAQPQEESTPEELPSEQVSAAPVTYPELPPNPLLELIAAAADFESELVALSNRWLPSETHLLRREADIVERRGIGRVLLHGRWLQAVPARDAPAPILIQAGENFAGTRELEGTVAATLGRYLHFQATLLYRAPNLGLQPIDILLRDDGSTAQSIPDLEEPLSYLLLDESRRMRSEEIHYLDHPKFGIVVRIDPVKIPQQLLDAFENLEEEEPE